MSKYRIRQPEVEARQLGIDYDEDIAVMRWCGGVLTSSSIEGALFHVPVGKSPHVRHAIAKSGDWVVNVRDAFLVLDATEFAERYEVVPETVKVPETKPPKAAEAKAVVAPTPGAGGG